MAQQPDIKVNLFEKMAAKQIKIGEATLTPVKGSKFEICFEDANTEFTFDYTDAAKLKLTLDGKVKVFERGDTAITVGAGISHDILKNSTEFEGRLELIIDKDLSVGIKGVHGPDESVVTAGLTLEF